MSILIFIVVTLLAYFFLNNDSGPFCIVIGLGSATLFGLLLGIQPSFLFRSFLSVYCKSARAERLFWLLCFRLYCCTICLFNENIVNAFLMQKICGQYACNASANDKYIGAFFALKSREFRHSARCFP